MALIKICGIGVQRWISLFNHFLTPPTTLSLPAALSPPTVLSFIEVAGGVFTDTLAAGID